jgi:tetratricopeptide (TPR) repeat protein
VELGSGAPDQAVVTLLKALEMNERYAPALFNLAVIQQSHLRDNEQAVAYFGKYLAVAPTDDPHVAGARDALAALRGERAEEGDRVSPVVTPAVQEQPLVAAPVTNAAEPVPPKPVAASADDVLNQAVRLADKGKTQLALELALQVAGNAERAGNIELQERALRTAVRGAFDQPRAHYELGRFLMAQKKPEAALKSFKQAIVLDNKFAAAQVAMAEAAVQAGEIDAALSGLKQAAQNDPKNPEALYALARLYDEQLDVPEKAARAYAEFATKFPKDSRAAGAREQAKKLWPSIQFPEYVPVPSGATPITVTARVAAASSPAPGVPARRIVYKKPAQKNNRAALQALDRGNHYQEQGKWNDAIDFYTRSLESDDEVASTWYNLGVAYAVKRDFDLAKDAYLRALALQPSQDNARYNLALIYCEQNDPASAIALLKEVVKNNSGHAAAHYVLGYLYDKHESTIPLAKQHYREYLRLTPNDPSARAVRQWLSDHS